jgi:hypothetical protein
MVAGAFYIVVVVLASRSERRSFRGGRLERREGSDPEEDLLSAGTQPTNRVGVTYTG